MKMKWRSQDNCNNYQIIGNLIMSNFLQNYFDLNGHNSVSICFIRNMEQIFRNKDYVNICFIMIDYPVGVCRRLQELKQHKICQKMGFLLPVFSQTIRIRENPYSGTFFAMTLNFNDRKCYNVLSRSPFYSNRIFITKKMPIVFL